MSQPIQVAHGLIRAASAFLSTLARRTPETGAGGVRDAPPAAPSKRLRRAGVENRCPVCQARFRGARTCSRCGAGLEPLMRLAVQAWQLRQAARQALDAGDVETALGLATAAQGLQATESGAALRLLGAWLKTGGASGPVRGKPVCGRSAGPAAARGAAG